MWPRTSSPSATAASATRPPACGRCRSRPRRAAAFDDSSENILSGKYPLARFLYVYVNKAPNKPADPLVREFVKFVLSQQGQQTVVKDGFIPLPNKIVQEELAKLQ